MPAASLVDKITAFQPRATALQSRGQKVACGADTLEMRVDLLKLFLCQGLPLRSFFSAIYQFGDLADREADLLEKGDDGEPLQNRCLVVATPSDAGRGLDETGLFVVPESGALEARRLSDLGDAQKFLTNRLPPLDLKRTSTGRLYSIAH